MLEALKSVEINIRTTGISIYFPPSSGRLQESDILPLVKALKCATRIVRHLKGHGMAGLPERIKDEEL